MRHTQVGGQLSARPYSRRWRGERPYKNDAALVRAGICGWAGNSRPAPTTLFLRDDMDDGRLWWRWAGESSRKPQRPRPYSRRWRGCLPYKKTMRHYNNRDAARHVATNAGDPTRAGALAALGTAPTGNAAANLANR